MKSTDLLADAFERIRDAVYPAVTGLSLAGAGLSP